MRGMLSPSLMCADVLNLQSELTALDNLGVNYIHLDFMDNHFVPNLTLSTEMIKATKSVLRHMKRDIHILAYHPERYFDGMDIGQGDIVSVHYEACDNLGEVLDEIRRRGASPSIAISPDTKPEVLLDWLDRIDMVLVMTVRAVLKNWRQCAGLSTTAVTSCCSRSTVTSAGSCAHKCAHAAPTCSSRVPPLYIRRGLRWRKRSPE